MTRRVLIVASSYRPIMLADMQRARMLAWELPALGWDVEVLTPASTEVRQDALEPDGDCFFPPVPVHEVSSFARAFFRAAGSRSHGWSTLWPLYRAGCALLAKGRFDLVYFSTTTFIYFAVGPVWRRKFGVPYVLDFHDPWVKPDTGQRPSKSFMSSLGRRSTHVLERLTVTRAAGIVSVSPQYVCALQSRYRTDDPVCLKPARHAVIPFGAREGDLLEAKRGTAESHTAGEAIFTINYVGAGGPIMAKSFALICNTLAWLRTRGDKTVEQLRIRLFGTTYNWRPGAPKSLEEVARAAGVADLVDERPARISYRRSLQLALAADGLLILGVDDPGYIPSKLFNYALTGRPILASLRGDGPAMAQFRENPGLGHALWFDESGDAPACDCAKIARAFLQEVAERRTFDRRSIIEPHFARTMSRRHVELFDACIRDDCR